MKKKQSGLSLIEVLVAMGVIAVAVVSVLGVVTHTTAVKESNRELQLAKTAATRQLEQIRSFAQNDFDNVVTTYDNTTFNVSDLANTQNLPSRQGLGTITIDESNPELLDVLILITWEGIRGASRYEIRSMLTR